ncbi:MAG: hypothetical protein RLZZ16_657, partial [Actinomycetota bacterium]
DVADDQRERVLGFRLQHGSDPDCCNRIVEPDVGRSGNGVFERLRRE